MLPESVIREEVNFYIGLLKRFGDVKLTAIRYVFGSKFTLDSKVCGFFGEVNYTGTTLARCLMFLNGHPFCGVSVRVR